MTQVIEMDVIGIIIAILLFLFAIGLLYAWLHRPLEDENPLGEVGKSEVSS